MKLFRRIRQTLIKEANIKRYLIYALGEILLVMIGISLAFQVNNWNDYRIRRNSEIRYYENVRDQIADDKELIEGQMEFNDHFMTQFKYASNIIEANDRTKMDTLGVIIRNLSQYSDFDKQGNIYETMVNSGQIKILQSHEVVNGIRELEEYYIYINRMESIHYDAVMMHVVLSINTVLKYASGEIKKPNDVFTYEFQNLIVILMQIMEEKHRTYYNTLKEIDLVTELINKAL